MFTLFLKLNLNKNTRTLGAGNYPALSAQKREFLVFLDRSLTL